MLGLEPPGPLNLAGADVLIIVDTHIGRHFYLYTVLLRGVGKLGLWTLTIFPNISQVVLHDLLYSFYLFVGFIELTV